MQNSSIAIIKNTSKRGQQTNATNPGQIRDSKQGGERHGERQKHGYSNRG